MKDEHIEKILAQIAEGKMPYERFCRLAERITRRYPDDPLTKLANTLIQNEEQFREIVDLTNGFYSSVGFPGEYRQDDSHFVDLAQYTIQRRKTLLSKPKKRHYISYLIKQVACF